MWTMLKTACFMLAAAALATCAGAPEPAPHHVLIFSHSTGYRHASIEPGIAAITALGERAGYVMSASEDPDIFSDAGLAPFDAIVLLSISTRHSDPSSEFFTGTRREAFENFVHRGGGVVGIHAASDSHYNWPWYGQMIGGWFDHHPPGTPEGQIRVVDADHPATRGMPATATRTDEWYYIRDLDPNVRLLVTYDPASIGQPEPGPNPLSWAHEFEGGRVFYTAMGHTSESYAEPLFLNHIAGGLAWVLRDQD
jgi:uncharacterized protein